MGKDSNVGFLGVGARLEGKLSADLWMPKPRYSIMKKYMPKVGTLGHHMMKRTCTNQVNLDYHSEEDMITKYRLMLNLEGIATAIFANSPFDQKEVSKYKSLRSHFWHHTDKDRTGLLPFVFDKDFNFEKYAEHALDVPMYFVIRNHKYIDMTNYTFRDFMKNNISKDLNIEPTIEDWINHLSTLFPQVRLKQFLEIRSMDACSWDLICSQPAFWIGILYNDEAIDKTNEIVEGWTQNDRNLINSLVPKEGLQTKFKNGILLDIAQKLFEKAPDVFNASIALRKKADVLPKIKEGIFCWHEAYFKAKIYCGMYLGNTIFPGWYYLYDLRKNPEDVLKLIESKKLSSGHAKILVGLENSSFVANKIIEKKLSVRQSENFVKIFKNKKQKSSKLKDTNIIALELSISNKIGLNVDIKNNKRNKGKISFEYKDLDQLNKIIDIIKSNY